MIYQEYISERKNTDIGPMIKKAQRPARLADWFPVIRLWLKIVWRDFNGARISAKTAWEVSEGVHWIRRTR